MFIYFEIGRERESKPRNRERELEGENPKQVPHPAWSRFGAWLNPHSPVIMTQAKIKSDTTKPPGAP